MKLDRNINKDGRGKYALIKMRSLTEQQAAELLCESADTVCFSTSQICTGDESPGDMFFVLKYRDKFAASALRAYARAIREEAAHLLILDANDPDGPSAQQRKELEEYAREIDAEGLLAHRAGDQIPS